MKKRDEGGLDDLLPAEVLKKLNELLEQLHKADFTNHGSKIEIVYVASGGQHVETQINVETCSTVFGGTFGTRPAFVYSVDAR